MKSLENCRTTSRLRDYLKDEKVTDMVAIDLLEKMLVMNPENRISVREILEHPYLSDPLNPPAKKNELPRLQTLIEFQQMKKEKEKAAQEAAAQAAAA